jgi:hypothetical protein
VLTVVSLSSLLAVFGGLAYAIYAVVVWMALASVQPGWFTTSLVLSLTATFLGGAIFGLSIGLQKLIETPSSDMADDIIDERGRADMFDRAMKELNVDVGADPVQVTASDPADLHRSV